MNGIPWARGPGADTWEGTDDQKFLPTIATPYRTVPPLPQCVTTGSHQCDQLERPKGMEPLGRQG